MLQAELGVPLRELAATGIQSDPFLCGTEDDWEKARWVEGLVRELGVSLVAHQRGLHYALLSHGATRADGKLYGNREADEDFLGAAVAKARELGVFPRDAFPDKKGQVYLDASDLRAPVEATVEIEGPSGTVPTLDEPQLLNWHVEVERPDELQMQPLAVEVLTEKDAVAELLQPILERYGCRLTVFGGYTNKARANEIVKRAIEDGRPVVVLTLFDADSAGESMPVACGRHLEFAVRQAEAEGEQVPTCYLAAVALTLGQVEEIEQEIGSEIPRAPDKGREIGRVELDALPYFAPGWIERQLEQQLQQLFAQVDYAPVFLAEKQLHEELDQELAPVQDRIDAIQSKVKALLSTPDAQTLHDQLGLLRERLDDAVQEGQEIADSHDAQLPAPEVEDLDAANATDWLLDTDRDYLEQLNEYRRHEPIHRRRPPLEPVERPGCDHCGGDMTHKRAGARYCSDTCRSTASTRRWRN